MMILLRKLLFPFAVLYGVITGIRNYLYDCGLLKSATFQIPIIAVGNLSVGGTGKSPQIEYLIRLLSDKYRIATLSRGYKRKSEGFVLADENASAALLGDEPFQFYSKFKNVTVAVDADRKNGITQLLQKDKKIQVILLDDAFQHRKVKAGFYILLTAYGDLYADDFMLPTGNLRESTNGANRADVVVVTKCPENLSAEAQQEISRKLQLEPHQELYFSFIGYDEFVYSSKNQIHVPDIKLERKIVLAGIAKPTPFFNLLQNDNDIILKFSDHHSFSDDEIQSINNKAGTQKIITTEKDYVRLKDSILADRLYYLPIRTVFVGQGSNFDNKILNYVGKSTRNS